MRAYAAHPGYRIANHRTVQAQLFQWRKLFWLAVIAVGLGAGDAALLKYGRPSFVTALVRAWETADMPAVATAASFSVSAGSFPTEVKAATFAAALDASGLPILVRVRPADGQYQVLVGPYISTDEAEHAQRALAAWGLGEARLVVDDTMRSPQQASVFGVGGSTPGSVVLVAAAGISSVVFEMSHKPRDVEARRTSATTLEVSIGSGQRPAGGGQEAGTGPPQTGDGQALSLPDGVLLLRALSVASGTDSNAMRARLVVPEGVQSRLRLEGDRVYVDLSWPKAPWTIRSRVVASSLDAHAVEPASTAVPAIDAYHEQLTGIAARFTEIEPFLMSAADSPEPDVLAALGHSLTGVRDSIAGMTPPPDLEANRQALLAAIARASSALTPAFAGDRAAAVREAIGMFAASSK